MSNSRKPPPPEAADLRRRALARWDNEGGASGEGPQETAPEAPTAKDPNGGQELPRGAEKAKP